MARKKYAVLFPGVAESLVNLIGKVEEWRLTDPEEIDVLEIKLGYGGEPAPWLRIVRDEDTETLVILNGDLEVRDA